MVDLKRAAQGVAKVAKGTVETTKSAVETAKTVASKMSDMKAEHDEKALRRRFQKATKMPDNAPPDLEICKVGSEARKWPRLKGEWLDAFPNFPYHIRGLKCCRANDVWTSYTMYLGPKDRNPLQILVDLANDRLAEASLKWGNLPVFRHAVPALHGNPRDVVTWPPSFAKLTARPFAGKKREMRDLPFGVAMTVPYWRSDGFFDRIRLECDLDASGAPHKIVSHYEPYYQDDVGLDYVEFASRLTDDGWEFIAVETQDTQLRSRSRSLL